MKTSRYLRGLYAGVCLGLVGVLIFIATPATSTIEKKAMELPTSREFISTLSEQEQAWLTAHPVIRVTQDPGWPPVEFINERNEFSGISADYLTIIEQLLGIKLTRVQARNWLDAYDRLKRWEIDMTTSVAETPKRTEFWTFTRPYLNIPIVIATQMDVTYIADLHEISDKKIAVVKKYAIDDWLARDFPEIQRVQVKNTRKGLEMLQRGEVFAYLDNLLIIGYYQAKMKNAGIKIAGQTAYVNAQCMAVRKDWAPLAGILQKAMESIPRKQHDEIYRKWLPVRFEHGFNYLLFWQVLGVFTMVLVALIFWNRKLTREIGFRKRAEDELRQYAHIVSNAQDMLALIDKAFIYLSANPAYLQAHMKTSDQVIGRSVPQVFGNPFFNTFFKPKAVQCLAGETIRYQHWFNYSTTGQRYMDVAYYPYRGPDHDIRGMVIIARDITAQENLQAQLFQAQKMASLGRLAGGVAHDYNNALSVIIGFTELAMDDVGPTAQLRTNLNEILMAAQRAADITRQLLAFARKQTITPRELNLNEIVTVMLKMLQHLMGEDITLTWLPGRELWPVKMDPSQINQILTNLCVNARDAIPGVGKITIETDKVIFEAEDCAHYPDFIPGEFVMLAVSDNGCGMDKEIQDKIFEPFFTTKETEKGTGLGLSMVFGIIKQNNGFMNVNSEPGQGTTIKIYLPRHEMDDRTIVSLPKPTQKILRGNGETILVVEDAPQILKIVSHILTDLGYKVLCSDAPGKALRLARDHGKNIDLLLTDVIMPEMNGQELAETLQSFYPDLKRIFMSGYTSDVIGHHGVLDQGVHFIQKPFSKRALAEKIRYVLDYNRVTPL